MITIQGPRDQDVAYREEPRETYRVEFRDINGNVLYSAAVDSLPTQEQMQEIFNREVVPLYPNIQLI